MLHSELFMAVSNNVLGPCASQEVKHHPASVDLELVKRLAANTTTHSLQSFLCKDFSCISKEYAGECLQALLNDFGYCMTSRWLEVSLRRAKRHRLFAVTGRLIDELRSGVDVETHPSDLTTKQITRLHQLLHEAKFNDPDGSHLSPAGISRMELLHYQPARSHVTAAALCRRVQSPSGDHEGAAT